MKKTPVTETGQPNSVWTIEEDKHLFSIISDQITRSKVMCRAIAKDIPGKSKQECHERLKNFFYFNHDKTSGSEFVDFAGMFNDIAMEDDLFKDFDFDGFDSYACDPSGETGILATQTCDLSTLATSPDSTHLLCNESLEVKEIEELENKSDTSSGNTEKTWQTHVPTVVISIKNWTNVRNPFDDCNAVINKRTRKKSAFQRSKLIVPGTMAYYSYNNNSIM